MTAPLAVRRLVAAPLLALAACSGPAPSASPPEEPPVTNRADPPAAEPVSEPVSDPVAGFRAVAAYVDDRGARFGTRFEHAGTGLPVTVLRIRSVPQVFLHVNTPPVSDRGEPHTGEHLLLGKGNKGRLLSSEQGMSLVGSTAYTSQTDVVYAWNCAAGKETFFRSLEQYLDALLLPDYTDEEVRREVCHLGVARGPDGTLALEEKGTIYNEMVSAYEKRWNAWREIGKRLHGPDHPLSWSSGGEPSAVREMLPEHIHDFHRDHYHLSPNLGLIVALPDTVPESEFLERTARIVAELEARPELAARPKTVHGIPPGRPSPDRSLRVEPFPNANPDEPGVALLAWPPAKELSQREQVLAELFLDVLATGESATLYKRLMDTSTREVEVDAAALFGTLDVSPVDAAAIVGFDGFPPRNATPERLARIERVVRDEIARVAALGAGDPALADFDRKALARLEERRKGLRKALDSPPLFGHRSTGGFWLDHLRLVDRAGGAERSVTLTPVFDAIRAELEAGGNPWTLVVERLGLAREPYKTVSVPSPEELARRGAEKAERLALRLAELRARYGVEDDQEAIRRYAADYERATAELEAMERGLPKPRLVPDVPLTADPSLELEAVEAAGVRGHRGLFENVASVETSIHLSLHGVDPEDYVWLPVLPALLTRAGVVEDGVPVPYDAMEERLAREIHSLSAEYAMRPSRDRHELRVTASGGDAEEALRAVRWMELALLHPWHAQENLPRLRDLVARAIGDVRSTLGGREENWVNNPANALRFQDDPLYLSAASHHVALLHLARLEWRLMEPPLGASAKAVESGLDRLGAAAAGGADAFEAGLVAVERACADGDLAPGATWLVPLARRLRELHGDMDPAATAQDVPRLVGLASRELLVDPAEALRQLGRVRESLLARSAARFTLTGSTAGTDAVLERVAPLLERFAATAPVRWARGPRVVDGNLGRSGPRPVHLGLVHGGGTSGVLVLSADCAGLEDVDPATLTRELAARVYGGAGPHALFMRTWGAGLAYSNGLGASAQEGRIRYYAERCPDLVQTMRFVAEVVAGSDALDDPYLAEYAIANAVAHSRESERYETRTRAAADDLVDGDTPERVARWRRAVLALRDDAQLWERMRPQIVPASGRVLVGVGAASREAGDPVFLAIAPPDMLDRWAEHVAAREPGETLERIWPRDFWTLGP